MTRARWSARVVISLLCALTGCDDLQSSDEDLFDRDAPLACRTCYCGERTETSDAYALCVESNDPAGTAAESVSTRADACRRLDRPLARCRDACVC